MTRGRIAWWGVAGLALASLLLGWAGCGDGGADASDTSPTPGAECARDPSNDSSEAVALALDSEVTGYLCPIEDVDWYRVDTGASAGLLRVRLAVDGELSPVEPSYAVYRIDGDGGPGEVVGAPPATLLGQALDEVHCVSPGSYLVAVRDDGDDAQDFRRPYRLTVSASPNPDTAEPNDDAAGATPLASGAAAHGAISCGGDEDWFAVDLAAGQLVRARLELDVAGFDPTVRLVDAAGELVGLRDNPSGRVSPTDIELALVPPGPGRYYVVVGDDDGRDADPEAEYTLTVTAAVDDDPNEPNHHPDVATPLATTADACGAAAGAWREEHGTIGAPGDNDWYRLPVTGCAPQGLLEAEVEYDVAGLDAAALAALRRDVQLAVTFVRAHRGSPCQVDSDCQALAKTCQNSWDCSGLFNACRPDGFCAGAAVCLPEGVCGANVIQRREMGGAVAGPGPETVRLSAPLFGDEVVYLRVADFQSDGAAPGVSYRVRARVRAEPDANEPSNVYAPELLESFPTGIQASAAKPVPVHDCTGLTPDCCGPDTWVEGEISYENDLDWYRYDHPCPGEDCNLRLVYELGGGPVDFVVSFYREGGLWFGGVVGPGSEAVTQSALSGHYGGVGPGDSCLYAFSGHEGADYTYQIVFRDLATVRDWSPEQGYRFCLEKVSTECAAPCELFENGCGVP